MTTRAFTMIETMVALALAGIIIAGATTAAVSIYRSTVAIEQQSYADEEAKAIIDYLTAQVLQTGGGEVRPWAAIHNGCVQGGAACAGNGGQRLDILVPDASASQCIIAAATAADLDVTPVAGTCCISAANGYPDTGTNVLMLPAELAGGGWATRRCTPKAAPACGCTLAAIVGGVDLAAFSGVTQTFAGGTLAVGSPISFELDAATETLSERRDVNNDGTADVRVLSDRVADFRVQYGYDGTPEDGVLDGGWHTVFDPRTDSAVNANLPTALRMARLGVILRAPVPSSDRPSAATLFSNAPVTSSGGALLRAAVGGVTLRNLLVFF